MEEALREAIETRNTIRSGNADAVSILRSCSTIAHNSKKVEDAQWIYFELNGYPDDIEPFYRVELPEYRKLEVPYESQGKIRAVPVPVKGNIFGIQSLAAAKTDFPKFKVEGHECHFTPFMLQNLLNMVINRCFDFLNKVISELQYSGVIESLMEEIRLETDSKLSKLDTRIAKEAESLCIDLKSDNPSDWSKVGHSCRSILKLVADRIYPEKAEPFKSKNGKTHELTSDKYINRLLAFLDEKTSEKDTLLKTELQLLGNNLDNLYEKMCSLEHDLKNEKYYANMVAIRTYLVISDILRYYQA